MATISYDKVQDYLTSLVPPREPELQAMEEYAAKNDFPITFSRGKSPQVLESELLTVLSPMTM